jgi:uncharacterized membrane protein
MENPESQKSYAVGVMKTLVEGRESDEFSRLVDEAVARVDALLSEELNLRVDIFEFAGPHLSPVAGTYSPLDFLQIGVTEKLERNVHFLLMVSDVDLSSSSISYVVALTSQLTNVAVLSTKRLSPSFWGEPEDFELTVERLTALMLHAIGHLLNLRHEESPQNALYDFKEVQDLAQMQEVTAEQIAKMRRILPEEARDRTTRKNRFWFTLRQIVTDRRAILGAVYRANPFYLLAQLPTMIAAAISVVIVLFFTAEIWDVASTVDLYQLLLFSVVGLVVSTAVLYRAFGLSNALSRRKTIAETTVVTWAATVLSLFLTMILFYVTFFVLTYVGTKTIFPRKLMGTWPTVDPAVREIDHLKLSMFLAAIGVLAGSLGGRTESQELVRHILFIDEET